MKSYYSPEHEKHHGQTELIDGQMTPCFEKPARVHQVLERLQNAQLGAIGEPREFGQAPLQRVHSPAYLEFLASAWSRWAALGRQQDALPLTWPARTTRSDVVPDAIDGALGYYSLDAGVPITAGTWEAARASANVALSAAAHLMDIGTGASFALCRPPGHHAGVDTMAGYCYLNNAAIATQYLRDQGARRVAVLDVDYHHGNGTQSIFYHRSDVLTLSLHADPRVDYPFFLGHADERGAGAGLGYNQNYPLPHGTCWQSYEPALLSACDRAREFAPDVLVISLGVDTFEHDPISKFRLVNDDYLRLGEHIARIGCPTLFVMEGGYAVDDIGVNTVNVLTGFKQVA